MRSARALPRLLIVCGVLAGLAMPSTASAAPSAEEIRAQIEKSSADLEKVVESYNKLNVDLTRSRSAATAASARVAPLASQYDTAQESVGQLAVDAYKTGEFASLSALLDSGSTGGLLSRVTALAEVARARQAEVGTLAARRDALSSEQYRLDALVATQTAQQQALAARKAQIEKDLDRLYALREQAYGSATETPASSSATAPSISGKAGVAVKYAYDALGTPYVWAADGPDGYDCSGLTLAAWRAAGVSLTHAASEQYADTARVSRSQLQPGDLVFYSDLGHVALYVGSGQVIHAPTFGEVVKLASVDMMTPYGYGRVRT